MTRLAFVVIFLITLCTTASGHSLGIDPARLVEKTDGTYELSVTIPGSLAHLVTTINLPKRCMLTGRPRGLRGQGNVSFPFKCSGRLTADDVIVLPWGREGVMFTASWRDTESGSQLVRSREGAIAIDLSRFQARSGTWVAGAKRYFVLGIEHILEGIDHLLFVLGLLLLVRGTASLVKTVTAFTIAHSLTLALVTFGYLTLPTRSAEAVIALSIVFLAREVLSAMAGKTSLTLRQPWLVAFGFGLVHGLGFAGALSQLGLPETEVPLALLFFNLGVEAGQLFFVLGVLALLRGLLIAGISVPAWSKAIPAYGIGIIGTYWFIDRALPLFVTWA
jgi:hydrogenase/urease accessory protein HupE